MHSNEDAPYKSLSLIQSINILQYYAYSRKRRRNQNYKNEYAEASQENIEQAYQFIYQIVNRSSPHLQSDSQFKGKILYHGWLTKKNHRKQPEYVMEPGGPRRI